MGNELEMREYDMDTRVATSGDETRMLDAGWEMLDTECRMLEIFLRLDDRLGRQREHGG